MLIYDRAIISSRERTNEGYLKVRAKMSRTGIQDYYRSELGLSGNPSEVIHVLRPPEEVFDQAALASFAMKPVTDDHPREMVSADNFRDYAVGYSGETIDRDGDFTLGTLLITDRAAIAKIESGKAEISLGYDTDLEFKDGFTADGAPFNAIQRKIRGNHIALVDVGRCGGECRIMDRKTNDCGPACDCTSCYRKKEKAMSDKPNAEFVVDGLPVETIEEHRQVIKRLQDQRATDKERMREIHNEVVQAQDRHRTRERELEDQIADLKSKVSDTEIDKRAEERLEVVLKAADFLPNDYETSGKTTAQIAKDAVSTVCGADSIAGKSDDYIRAKFDDLDPDDVDAVTLGGAVTATRKASDARDNGQAAYKERLSKSWRGQEAAAQ